MNKIEEFVDELQLPYEGKMQGEEYVVKLDNSNDFSKLYNIISTNKQLNLERNSMATKDTAMFVFYNDWYEIRFTADFNKDVYRMVVSRR